MSECSSIPDDNRYKQFWAVRQRLQDAEAERQRLLDSERAGAPGGQHRAPQGVSTLDNLTDAERAERRRRLLAELETEVQEIEDTGGASYW